MRGVPKSAKERMNTISAEARMEGMHSGITTFTKRLMPFTPMLAEASSRVLSTFFSAPLTYMNTSGNILVERASRMPPKP